MLSLARCQPVVLNYIERAAEGASVFKFGDTRKTHDCSFTLGFFPSIPESPLQRYHLFISSTGVDNFYLSH